LSRPRTRFEGRIAAVLALAAGILAGDCRQNPRHLTEAAPSSGRPDAVQQGTLQPGPKLAAMKVKNPYEGNPFEISEGQRLYNWYNCSGCHFRGGGGIGPPLMDDFWIYGGEPQNIYATIVEGRPNGMPSFRRKIPSSQIWQIVAYIQTMQKKPIAFPPGPREDHLQATEGKESK
jgi:cytochrome c oxidase cbb3-type subunit 3